MTRIATAFAIIGPQGDLRCAEHVHWRTREAAEAYGGNIYGHDGTWAAAAADGYTVQEVDVCLPGISPDPVTDMLRAARAVLSAPMTDAAALACAIVTVERLDPDPLMQALAARRWPREGV